MGDDKFYLNTPLFRLSRLALDKRYHSAAVSGMLTVECDEDPGEYPYIDRVEYNGVKIDRHYLTYTELTAGGIVKIYLKK